MNRPELPSHSFLTSIAKENKQLLQRGSYTAGGTIHHFSSHICDVLVFPQSKREQLTGWGRSQLSWKEACIQVAAGDTTEYAGDAVLNFASAVTPGGGYLRGSRAQEECLCRETTLYPSLTSPDAACFYQENRAQQTALYTHTFLISPHIEIFRTPLDRGYTLLPDDKVTVTAVLTVPAPNLIFLSPQYPRQELRRLMQDRIRFFLAGAAHMGFRTLTLGAWGCGAFRHDAADVAADFHQILIEENWQSLFDAITFAIYPGGEIGTYNLKTFQQAFRK